MLGFFRKYQRFFFIIITTVIFISFSFFGVMSSIANAPVSEGEAFEAVDGTSISKQTVRQMAHFLATDAQDKLNYGGVWGPNFLNDGIIQKDFLETGLATVVAKQFQKELASDFAARSEKEKRFRLYHYPNAEFLSVENAWGFLAPEMRSYFRAVQNSDNPIEKEALEARVGLYLGQKKLSPLAIKRVLMSQKRQYEWLPDDPALPQADLSLFGYHTVEDWFGVPFLQVAAATIINVAKLAEQQGIQISKAEAEATLLQNVLQSYEQNKNSPYIGVVDSREYLEEQLRRMHLSFAGAVSLWRDVLLFRAYLQGVGESVLIEGEPSVQLAHYSGQSAEGVLYQLPTDLRLKNFRDLQRFEVYLNAISSRDNLLSLPAKFYATEKIAKTAPELVEKRFRLSVASTNSLSLEKEVGLKEMWSWQTNDAGWKLLQNEFPDLARVNAETADARFSAIEKLDSKTHDAVDRFSRHMIVGAKPELVAESLQTAPREEAIVAIRRGGTDTPFAGVKDSGKLIQLLDKALAGDSAAQKKLSQFSEDDMHFFAITVLDAAPQDDILTFAEVREDGTLDKILNRTIENYYETIRARDPGKYKAPSGDWKSIDEVRQQVAKEYFTPILQAIQQAQKTGDQLTVDDAALHRFDTMMSKLEEKIKTDKDPSRWVRAATTEEKSETLQERPPLTEQWKVIQENYTLNRQNRNNNEFDAELVLALEPGSWSSVVNKPSGNLIFYRLDNKGVAVEASAVAEAVRSARSFLGNQARQEVLQKILPTIQLDVAERG